MGKGAPTDHERRERDYDDTVLWYERQPMKLSPLLEAELVIFALGPDSSKTLEALIERVAVVEEGRKLLVRKIRSQRQND